MRTRGSARGGLLVALAAPLATLALATAPAAAQNEAAYTDWNPTFPGFPSDVRPDARADCANGSDACIDRTIEEMYRRFHTVLPRCGHNAVFSLTYTRVTEDIRNGIHEGFYRERIWINPLDAMFARLYFIAYDNWAAGRRHLVPPAWRIAYDSARDKRVAGLGNLLLSMNAHINRDFPFVLWRAGLTDPAGRSRKPDHDSGNQRLRAMYRPILTELSQRFDETIDDYDAPGTIYDDEAIFQILVGWRESAWRYAEQLAAADSDDERHAVAQSIEENAIAQAQTIHANTAYRPGEGPSTRDARCARFGGQDPGGWRRGSGPLAGGTAQLAPGRRGLQRVGRAIRVRLSCPGSAPCEGRVALRLRRHLLGRARFSLRAGERATVRVRLTRTSRAVLARRRRPRVSVLVRSLLAPGETAVVRRRARVRG